MSAHKPDGDTYSSFYVEQWQSDIDDARRGDAAATRALIWACIHILRNKQFSLNVQRRDNTTIRAKARGGGYLPEPLCGFLLETLEKAMSVPKAKVGDAMGIGNLPKNARNADAISEFIKHYKRLLADCPFDEGTNPRQRRAEILEEIRVLMGTDLRSVQRYWKHAEYLFDFIDL